MRHRVSIPAQVGRTLSAATLWLIIASCGESATPEPAPASVAVQLAKALIDPGDTTRATVKAQDASGRDLTVHGATFSSSNAAIATVDTAGLVTATAEGSVTITATVRGIAGGSPLTVSYTVATVTVTAPATTVDALDTLRVSAFALSSKGVTINGRAVTYGTSNSAVATVSNDGLVHGESVGTATITATIDGKSGGANLTVQVRAASVVASHDTVKVNVNGTRQITAKVYDADGNELVSRSVAWSSLNPARASVSISGLVTWQSPGQTMIVARSGAAADTVGVTAGGDFSISGVYLTQGVQASDMSVPMIAQGNAVAALVMVTAPATITAPMKIVLRVLDATDAIVFADTETVNAAIGPGSTPDDPAVRFLVPADRVQTSSRYVVLRDPMGEVPDDDATNDIFPRTGPAPFAVSVPLLKVRFVPITLSAHGNTTPPLDNADLPGYLRTTWSTLPLGQVTTSIAPAFTTGASFGTPPSGGASSFWTQVLQELDAARVVSADPTVHWYGVVNPPAGFNFTQFGGFGYIPLDPISSGPGTRTALGVRTNWFFNQTQARDLLAHELSHNFGRRHTPCGGPSSIDPSYPRPDGRLGETMHDVWAWASAVTPALQQVNATTGDIMGYCFPGWSSSYTYKGIISGRGTGSSIVGAALQVVRREPVLVVQGTVASNGTPTLDYPLSLIGAPTQPDAGGEYRLEGLDETGGVVFTHRFRPSDVDHSDVRLFTIALRLDAVTSRARVLRVSGSRGTVSLGAAAAATQADVRPSGSNAISVSCGDATARVAVQDEITGDVLGIGRGPIRIVGARARRLAVSCANGVMPRRALLVAP